MGDPSSLHPSPTSQQGFTTVPDTSGAQFAINECSKRDCSSCLSSPSDLTELILHLSFPCSHLNPSCCGSLHSSFCQGRCHCPFQECFLPKVPRWPPTPDGKQELSRVSQPDSQRRCRSPGSLLPAAAEAESPCPPPAPRPRGQRGDCGDRGGGGRCRRRRCRSCS